MDGLTVYECRKGSALTFSVYVIRLRNSVLKMRRFARANPDHIATKPCVYVGSTALSPEQRYERHLNGKTGSNWVKDFHVGLHKKLTDKSPKYANRSEAEFAEFVLAMQLRKRGYGVWTNLPSVPAFYKETHFAANSWDGAPAEFAIITAYATTGERWTDKENTDADRRLMKTLRSYKVWMVPITGYSPTTGHREPGWAVDINHSRACDLGKWFKQDAIYWVASGTLYVSYCDDRRALVPVGKFHERLHVTPLSLP